MADFLHGVETIVVTKGPVPVREVKSAVIFLVGTAPVHQTKPEDVSEDSWYAETVNNPIMILDRETGAHYFGEPTPGYTIPYALDAIFDHGGTVVIVVNVFDPRVHVNDSNQPDPSKVQASDIIGTVTPTGERTGLQIVETLLSNFNFTAKILIAPGYSSLSSVATEMITKANQLSVRGIALIDAPAGLTPQDVINERGEGGILNFSNYRAIICYPHLKVWDTATNTERLEPFSARLAGVIAKVDHEQGYWWSPSNHEILGIIGMERPITCSLNDPATETNQLNAAGIVTVYNSFGTGYRVWGNRSSAYPTKTDPRSFINVQRTADIIAESIEYYAMQWLDKPIQVAIDGVLSGVNAFIRTLIGRGALIDGYCYFPKDKNPESELANGHLTFAYHIMPPPPAERITFYEVIDINLLKAMTQIAT